MLTVLLVVLAGAPSADVACLRVPDAVTRLGDEAVQAYRELLEPDVKAPRVSTAPAEARLLLRLIWTLAAKPDLAAVGTQMEDSLLGQWKKDATIAKKLRAAIAGSCTRDSDIVTCAAKKGPRLVLVKQNGCWRWTAFVESD